MVELVSSLIVTLEILHDDIFQDNLSKLFKFKSNWSGQGLFCLMDIVRLPWVPNMTYKQFHKTSISPKRYELTRVQIIR